MAIKVIRPETLVTTRLVKSEDLNHHGTLFAGRTAEWFVESGFIAATSLLNPQSVVCLNVHGMYFTKPARSGDVLKFSSALVYTGRTSLTVYIHVEKRGDEKPLVDGFVTFIHVNEETKPAPHYLVVEPVSDEEKNLFETAKKLRENQAAHKY
ncbi:MAG: acyl-CoA thioesterase [Bacteroidales bacterium]|nr:acyl-CoA thioesterase [Bacteroidales bacterium]